MRSSTGIGKRTYDLYFFILILVHMLPSIILCLMLFSPSVSASQNMINLGYMEHLSNNYGEINSIKVLKSEDFPYGEEGMDYAFCTTGRGMAVFGIYKDSNDQNTESLMVDLKAFFPVEGCVDIAIKMGESMAYNKTFYAYLAAESKGIYIIDITDPKMPKYIAGCDTPGYAKGVCISGDYAFVADKDCGLQIIDISDNNNPVIAGSCDTPGYALGTDISGDYAFVADGDSGLQIIDISDKASPVIIKSCNTPGSALGIAVSENYAFMADDVNGLQIIDVSDKNNPVNAGNCDTPGAAVGIAVSGDYAFVTNRGKGLLIINVSDKLYPQMAGRCETPGDAKGVTLSGDYAFVADGCLQIINVSVKSHPQIAGSYETQANAYGVTLSGGYAFVADYVSGLEIIDISDKSHLRIAGNCDTPMHAEGVAVSGGYAFVADGESGLQVIDISDKSNPVIAGSCDTPDYAKGVAISGDYAFMADGNSGLQIIDISDKLHPVIAGSCDTPDYAFGVAISGDYAFVADYYSGLQIIDISDKSHPQLTGDWNTPGLAIGVTLSGDYAFVADGESGLQIIDISDKSHPQLIGDWNHPDAQVFAMGVALSGDYAFLAAGWLWIIDISDKHHPELVGSSGIPDSSSEIALSGDYAFVADTDGFNGLLEFKISFEPSPKANLILLNGGGLKQTDEYWNLSQRISNGVFNTFINNGYEVYDIYYLTSLPQDVDNDGVQDQMAFDDLNEKTKLISIIKGLPDGHLSNTGPLYLVLIGHGADDQFQISMDRDNILSAQELKTILNKLLYYDEHFNPSTPLRPIIVILESAASGTFIDDLADPNYLYKYPYLDLTIITSTGHGASYIKPQYNPDNPLPVSFTSLLMREMEDYSLEDYQTSLKGAFIQARDKLYSYGHPFLGQAPQMYITDGPIAFVLEDPNIPADPTLPPHRLIITNAAPIGLTPVAIYPDGTRINLDDPGRLILRSSKPRVLNPDNPDHLQISNGQIILTPEKEGVITFKNGITSLIAYPDPNYYYPYHDILLTAHMGIEVLIPENPAAGGDKAIIVTGYRTQQGLPDTLWASTNMIGNHAYENLKKQGYSRDDIIYLNPYALQDVDRNSKYDDIDRIPSEENMDWAFVEIEKTGAERLLILLVDHGDDETFILNPKNNLSAEYLGQSITSLIPSDKNQRPIQGPVSLIIDACYSGSFVSPLEGYVQEYNGDPNQLIIITSAGAEQKARFSADGMISFSYPFFDELLLSNSIYNAFTYAKNYIPPSGQTPQISDYDLAQGMDQRLIYYIDEVRPLIEERDFYRDSGRLGINARVFSLSGIDRVYALITSTAQVPSVPQGEPLMNEPVIILEPQDPNPYGGTYSIEIDDPYPDAYNYQIILSVKDKKGIVSTERTNLNNQGRNKTGAILVVSDLGAVEPNLKSMIDDQSHRVYCILKEKHLRDSDIYYVKTRQCQYAAGIDDTPIFFDPQHIQTWPMEMGYQTFLAYLIGESQGGNFKLSSEHMLHPQQIIENISLPQGCKCLIFCEFPDSWDFLDNIFPLNDCNNWIGIASPYIDLNRHLFSNYFFSRLYSFDSIGEAFLKAYTASAPSREKCEYIYPRDYSCTTDTIRGRLAYSLGDPAIMGADQSLISSTEVLEEDETITLFLTVNEFADIDPNTPSAELHTTSGEIYTIPLSQIGVYKWGSTLDKDRTYSRVVFFVQQVQDASRPGIIDWREDSFMALPDDSPIDPNDKDDFEPDDVPGEAQPIWVQVTNDPFLYRQQHTFHNPNDRDWVLFNALKDKTYTIYAVDPEGIYVVQISLFDSNNINKPSSSNPWYFSWKCPEDGSYYLKTEPASAGVYSFSYNFWIEGEYYSPLDPEDRDPFELDDTPEEAKPIRTQFTEDSKYHQQHTFHNPNDTDWVKFYAYEDEYYGIKAEVDVMNSIHISLFDSNNLEEPLYSAYGYIPWTCPEDGVYYLKTEPASASVHSFSYSLWIYHEAGGTRFADIYGRVLNEKREGINNLLIHIQNLDGEAIEPKKTGSIRHLNYSELDPSETEGWFFFYNLFYNLPTDSSYEITVTTEEDNILANLNRVDLQPYDVVLRIPDIIIEGAIPDPNITPPDPNDNIYYDIYGHWQKILAEEYEPNEDGDNDGFTNEEEFLNSTHPGLVTLKHSLYPGLNLFPFNLLDLIKASDFFDNMLEEYCSIWGYNNQARVWNYCGPGAGSINFPLEKGIGYIIYKYTQEAFYQDIYSTPGPLAPGINLLSVSTSFIPVYTSHQFIKDKKAEGAGNVSLSNYNNDEEGGRSDGNWETSYIFFGRPAGRDFVIGPDKAYMIIYQEDE